MHNYYHQIDKNELAVVKGYFLNEEDLAFRHYILNISCTGHTSLNAKDLPALREFTFPELEELRKDGMVEWNEKEVRVTFLGRNFIRNVCKAFDLYLARRQAKNENNLFSKAI